MKELAYEATSEAQTERLGAALAAELSPGAVVALFGTLGAGKTRLVQAIATVLGVPADEATSPTFVLINEYHGRLPIYHFDAYRLRDDDEFLELGPDEYFEGDGVTFVEWADRVQRCLPAERLEIECEAIGETARRFTLRGTTPRMDDIVNAVRKRIETDA